VYIVRREEIEINQGQPEWGWTITAQMQLTEEELDAFIEEDAYTIIMIKHLARMSPAYSFGPGRAFAGEPEICAPGDAMIVIVNQRGGINDGV